MTPVIDVLTPLRHGRYIRGDTIAGFFRQNVPFRWYVDARPDLEIDASTKTILDRITPSAYWAHHFKHLSRIIEKRERLRRLGDARFVFSADSDVMLPAVPLFAGMMRALEAHDEVGAIGLHVEPDVAFFRYHVSVAAMMLRRADLSSLPRLRGAPCECGFIARELAHRGKKAIGLRTVHGHTWKRTDLSSDDSLKDVKNEHPCKLCGLVTASDESGWVDARLRVDAEGLLPEHELLKLLGAHGTSFRLYIEHDG